MLIKEKKMTAFERAELTATVIKAALYAGSLIGGAVLISMAYQSWEYGCGLACLAFFLKEYK
jgi:hypothetical protein